MVYLQARVLAVVCKTGQVPEKKLSYQSSYQ